MPVYKAPVDDAVFLLGDVLNFSEFSQLPGFGDVTGEMLAQILREAAKFAEEVVRPLNQIGDKEGCVRHDDASVTTAKGFKAAYRALAEGGWIGLAAPQEYGGQGLPYTLSALTNEFASSANMSFAMYSGLTQGALAALLRHGDEEQKRLYAPKMASGGWSGTMNLTEPQCGTDLGLLTTKADAARRRQLFDHGPEDLHLGRRARSGGKHRSSRARPHRRRARRRQGHFAVHRAEIRVRAGRRARRAQRCRPAARIEHKMGIHGNSTCVMNYDDARGYLVGEANRGLNAMFVMMNEARLGVAIQGLAQSEVAYQNAARLCHASACRAARSPAPKTPVEKPIRSSCIPTCAACCWRSGPSTRRRAGSRSAPRSTATSRIARRTRRRARPRRIASAC